VTPLQALKAQLNILDDTDDALLAMQLEAAQAFTARQIGAPSTVSWESAPADLRQAILMLAAWWYAQRESAIVGMTANSVPFGYSDLVLPHRNWTF
jgi:hypothetical protein